MITQILNICMIKVYCECKLKLFTINHVWSNMDRWTNWILSEECQSGWLERSWKPSYVRAYLGFESLFLLIKSDRHLCLSDFILQRTGRFEEPCKAEALPEFERGASRVRSVLLQRIKFFEAKHADTFNASDSRQSLFLLHLKSPCGGFFV